MRFRLSAEALAPLDVIRARLVPENWPLWWTGARPGPAGRVDLDLGGPRPLRVGLQVAPRDDGAEVALVEGELSVCHALVKLGAPSRSGQGPTGDYGEVSADVEITFPTAIPAALRHDLQVWLQSRVQALAAAPR